MTMNVIYVRHYTAKINGLSDLTKTNLVSIFNQKSANIENAKSADDCDQPKKSKKNQRHFWKSRKDQKRHFLKEIF